MTAAAVQLPQLDTDRRTHSAMACFGKCPRLYKFKVIQRLVRDRVATPLRKGTAAHIGHEAWNRGTQPRTNLVWDVWHPDLSPLEIEALAFLFPYFQRLLRTTL